MVKRNPGQPKDTSQDKAAEALVTRRYPSPAPPTKKPKKSKRVRAGRSRLLSPCAPENRSNHRVRLTDGIVKQQDWARRTQLQTHEDAGGITSQDCCVTGDPWRVLLLLKPSIHRSGTR